MKLHCAMQIQACTYYATPGVKLSRGVHVTTIRKITRTGRKFGIFSVFPFYPYTFK